MTGVPDLLRVIYGEPLPHRGPIAGQTFRQGTPWARGIASFARALSRKCCELPRANLPGPGQSDFGRIDISTVKDALESYMMTPIPGNPPYQRIWAGKSSCRAAVCVPFPRNF